MCAGVRLCKCVLSMAKWVTLICTAKQISASETRKMSFVFKDASTAEQQKRNWKTAERARESSSRKCYEYAITYSQRESHNNSTPSASAGDKHTHTLTPTHTHTHSGQCKLPADMKNYFTAAFTAASICLLPQSICVCVCVSVCGYTLLPLLQFRRHSATFCLLLITGFLSFDSNLRCLTFLFPFSSLTLQLCRRLSANENGNEN